MLTYHKTTEEEKYRITADVLEHSKHDPAMIQRGKMLKAYAERMPIAIADDELIEVTPKNIRLRKRILDTSLRLKAQNKKG